MQEEEVPLTESATWTKETPVEGGSAAPDDLNPSVSATGLSDSPSERDEIGFSPYVRAMCRFLCDADTKPPLTISVEGSWGSGKSSFLLQVASELRSPESAGKRGAGIIGDFLGKPGAAEERHRYTIWFNAWRSDKDEALWASFALVFMRQLGRQIPLGRRLRANLTLTFQRFDFDRSKFQLLQILVFLAALLVFVFIGFVHPEKLHKLVGQPAGNLATAVSAVALFGWAFAHAKQLLGNPLSKDLAKYIRNPRYEEKISSIDRFQEDFTRILQSYVGRGRVFVFIDDLDRCEVPRAADLMQAINLLLSADQPAPDAAGVLRKPEANLFFLLGLDRKVVAAGIAAKNEKILPYIASAQQPSGTIITDLSRAGLDFGYEFLEKFIQVPFRVPEMDKKRNEDWVAQLTLRQEPDIETLLAGATGPGGLSASGRTIFEVGDDPEGFAEVVRDITGTLQFNPRRVKQFINLFRPQVLILIETGVLRSETLRGMPPVPEENLTLAQIGLITGIFLRWPGLVADTLEDQELLGKLTLNITPLPTGYGYSPSWEYWSKVKRLTEALRLGGPYTVSGGAIRQVLDLVPEAYKGSPRWGFGRGRPARLVLAGQDENSNRPGSPDAPVGDSAGGQFATASPSPSPTGPQSARA